MLYSNFIKRIVPPLLTSLYKGQLGKIGIIGGCLEYTGAPYFAGISAQRIGADLVTIICSKEAGIPIKCYSPELIVYPVIQLSDDDFSKSNKQEIVKRNVESIKRILQRIDSLVIGPGAGRDPIMVETLSIIIDYVSQQEIPLVIDGDGLFVLSENPSILKKSNSVILTPNQMEFTRLYNSVMKDTKAPSDLKLPTYIQDLSLYFNGVTILLKGEKDQIVSGNEYDCVMEESSSRRCGGQGDVVAGVMGVMNLWANRSLLSKKLTCFAAAVCTSTIVRKASKLAFSSKKRAMSALTVIDKLSDVIDFYIAC